jgi:hypothetical protein
MHGTELRTKQTSPQSCGDGSPQTKDFIPANKRAIRTHGFLTIGSGLAPIGARVLQARAAEPPEQKAAQSRIQGKGLKENHLKMYALRPWICPELSFGIQT